MPEACETVALGSPANEDKLKFFIKPDTITSVKPFIPEPAIGGLDEALKIEDRAGRKEAAVV